MQKMNKSLLLDTHVFLWLISGEQTLTPKIRALIKNSATTNSLYLSAISLWEISMLAARGKINLGIPCLQWLNDATKAPGLQILPLTLNIAVESCHLPGNFHGDPADRIIVAGARVENLLLMTRDQKILAYSKNHHLQAHPV